MAILSVPGIHCGGCVSRISNALTEAGLEFEVSLENKTVTVNGDDAAVSKAKEEIEDLGFEVE